MSRLAALVLALGAVSCATVITPDNVPVTIYSFPPGAAVTTNTGESGVTPMVVYVPETLTLRVSATADGYLPLERSISPRPSAWLVGNLIFGPLVWAGVAIDVVSGNWLTHNKSVSLTLTADPAADDEPAPAAEAAEGADPSPAPPGATR